MRKFLIVLLVILLFLLAIFSIRIVITRRTSFLSKANQAETAGPATDLRNSYLFASPLEAASGGQEKIRVTAYILNETGAGVVGKTVVCDPVAGAEIASIQPVTDDYGRAYFDVSAQNPGRYVIQAKVDGSDIVQKLRLTFR